MGSKEEAEYRVRAYLEARKSSLGEDCTGVIAAVVPLTGRIELTVSDLETLLDRPWNWSVDDLEGK